MTNALRTLPFILISFLSIFLSNQMFAEVAALPKVETYGQLVQAIRQARSVSAQRVKQEKVRLAWETGKLIDEHILKNKRRAAYGKNVILRLARDLGTSETELRFMLDFARSYPIYPKSNELTWSDYRELLSLNDAEERQKIAERAEKEKWDSTRIRREIKRINASKRGQNLPPESLESKPGKVGVYRVIKAKVGPYAGQLALDLGFSNYYQPGELGEFKQGDIVFAERETNGYALSISQARFDDLYTYRAYVIDIIDGDTFTAIIDLGFEFVTEQKLRLRGLDAPEIESAEGQEAKAFLERELKKGVPILIKTVKSDKYDRYLADVFYTPARDAVKGKEKYLNNELLKRNLAMRVE